MIQLIVQGEELDLFKDEVFAISKSVSKVGQFDLRFGDVSISFNVPLTAKNNKVFRYISNLNNNNIGAFKRFEGEIREDDAILSRGFFQVLSTNYNKKEIKIRFLGGNSDWFDLIKDRFINENYEKTTGNPNSTSYSLNYLNHKFQRSSITASRNNEDGYFYFICDTGIDENKNDNVVTLKDFQLGVYEHTIFSNIFESVGIKIKGSMFNDPLYKSTIVNKPSDFSSFEGQNNFKRFTNTQGRNISKDTYEPIYFDKSDTDSQWNGNTFVSDSDINDLSFVLKYQSEYRLTGNDYGDLQIKCEYTLNGVLQPIIERILTVEDQTSGYLDAVLVSWQNENFSFSGDSVKTGDYFSFSIRNINYSLPLSESWKTNSVINYPDAGIVESFLSYNIEGATTPYDINNALPKIKQSDFVKDIMFRLGAISRYDSKKRILYFDKFQDVESNKYKAIDLTNKVDVSKDIEIDFNKLVSNYYKRSLIKYKEDDNDAQLMLFKAVSKNGLGDAVIEIENDNLTDEGTVFESQYAATFQKLSWDGNFYIPYIPVYNSDGSTNDLKPRILVASTTTDIEYFSTQFSLIDFENDLGNYGFIGYAFFC